MKQQAIIMLLSLFSFTAVAMNDQDDEHLSKEDAELLIHMYKNYVTKEKMGKFEEHLRKDKDLPNLLNELTDSANNQQTSEEDVEEINLRQFVYDSEEYYINEKSLYTLLKKIKESQKN